MKNTNVSARQMFLDTFKGETNLFTREVVRYGWVASGRHAYEVSKGESMVKGKSMYGVTFIDADGTHNHDLSEAVHSLDEVDELLDKVRSLYSRGGTV